MVRRGEIFCNVRQDGGFLMDAFRLIPEDEFGAIAGEFV